MSEFILYFPVKIVSVMLAGFSGFEPVLTALKIDVLVPEGHNSIPLVEIDTTISWSSIWNSAIELSYKALLLNSNNSLPEVLSMSLLSGVVLDCIDS